VKKVPGLCQITTQPIMWSSSPTQTLHLWPVKPSVCQHQLIMQV